MCVLDNARLVLKHCGLVLEASPVIFTRLLQVLMHPLYVGHEIRELGTLDGQSLVLFDKTSLHSLEASQRSEHKIQCLNVR